VHYLQQCTIEPKDRRNSNEGFRRLPLVDRVLLFLARLRRKVPFVELGWHYGCSETSAKEYFDELVVLFSTHLVPRLVFPRSPSFLREMTSPEVEKVFPDLLAILDGTSWEQLKPENFLENRLSYSAYKHFNAFQVLFGM
jgi:hypothetical protein